MKKQCPACGAEDIYGHGFNHRAECPAQKLAVQPLRVVGWE